MKIASVAHRKLRRFATTGNRAVIEPERLIDMLAFIRDAAGFEELGSPPNFGLHRLTGDRTGSYSMTVTRNWRLTFVRIDDETIGDLDLEDYH